MKKTGTKHVLSVVALVAGVLLLLSPVSGLADRPGLFTGLPFSMVFVFTVWMLIILFLFVSGRKTEQKR